MLVRQLLIRRAHFSLLSLQSHTLARVWVPSTAPAKIVLFIVWDFFGTQSRTYIPPNSSVFLLENPLCFFFPRWVTNLPLFISFVGRLAIGFNRKALACPIWGPWNKTQILYWQKQNTGREWEERTTWSKENLKRKKRGTDASFLSGRFKRRLRFSG